MVQRFKAALTTGYWPDNPEDLVKDNNGEYVKYSDYAELREAVALYLEIHMDRERSIIHLQDMGSSEQRAKHESIMRNFRKAESTIRALLSQNDTDS
jgi:hypothetical protein